jgi:hypothetical protein
MISSFFAALSVKKVDFVWGTSPPIFQGVTAWWRHGSKAAIFLFEVRDLWPEFCHRCWRVENPTSFPCHVGWSGFFTPMRISDR